MAGPDGTPLLVGEASNVAAQYLDKRADPFWKPYFNSLPTAADLAEIPMLWPDEEAERLEAVNLRRGACDLAPFDPNVWREMTALVMSRTYVLPVLGYATLPFVDFFNHNDEPTAEFRLEEGPDEGVSAVVVVAKEAIPEGNEVFASYAAGSELDALVMLQAFGWLPTDRDGNPKVFACNLDAATALRTDDPTAEAKFSLLKALPDLGRRVLALKGDGRDEARLEACGAALLRALRVATLDEEGFEALLLDEGALDAWVGGASISAANDRAAAAAGGATVRRAIAILDKAKDGRINAAKWAPNPHHARLARATADAELQALYTIFDWFQARAF